MDRYQIWGAAKKTARMTGKAVLAVVEIGFTIWVSELNAKQKAEEDTQAAKRREEEEKPTIIAEFLGNEDTFTAPFLTKGPWQLTWTGSLDIEVWRKDFGEPVFHGHASGWNGSTFFPEAGEFYLVVHLVEPGSWVATVRSR